MFLKSTFPALPGWLQGVLHVQYVWRFKAPDDRSVLQQHLLLHTRLMRRNKAASQGHFQMDNSPLQNMLDLDWECLTPQKQVCWQTSLPIIFHATSYKDWDVTHHKDWDVTAGGVSQFCPNNKGSCLQAMQSWCDGLWEPISRAQLQGVVLEALLFLTWPQPHSQ